jgi:hypothetical protein
MIDLRRVALAVLWCGAAAAVGSASQFVSTPLEATASRAAHAVVGRIAGVRARWGDDQRWIESDYTLRITAVLRSSSLRVGDVVTVTVLGGTLDGHTFSQEGLRRPDVGQEGIWLLGDGMRGGNLQLASARFGYLQGTSSQTLMARDGSAVTALRSNGREVGASDAMQILADSQEQPRQPAGDRGSIDRTALPYRLEASEAPGEFPRRQAYTLNGAQRLPIVFNPLHIAPWGAEDALAADHWNHYVNVFQTLRAKGTWGYRDGIVDNVGFMPSSSLFTWFGDTWDSDTLATTYTWSFGTEIVDADIAFNPDMPWTVNDAAVYSGGSDVSYVYTIAHELGHAAGLGHEFRELSLMNYPPNTYSGFSLPYSTDVRGLRANYPSATRARTDIGVYLYGHGASDSQYVEAAYPTRVSPGETITVRGFTIENLGTTSAAFAITWSLRSALSPSAPGVVIGRTQFDTLQPGFVYPRSNTSASLTVPPAASPGTYFLMAAVEAADDGPAVNYFPWSNSFAFSGYSIAVNAGASSAPSAPTALGASAVGSVVTVSWGAPIGGGAVTDYLLEAGTAPGLANLYNASVGLTTSLSAVAGPGTYYIRVRARNGAGVSPPSAEAVVTVGSGGCLAAPAAPTGIVGAVTGGMAMVQWASVAGASSYVVRAGSTPGAVDLFNGNVGLSTVVTSPVPPNFRAYVRIYALNACGESASSLQLLLQ